MYAERNLITLTSCEVGNAQLPSTCLCEKPFTVAHALSCPFGGFPSIRHNEVRNTLASSLKRVAHNVSSSPTSNQSQESDSTCDLPPPRIKLAWTWSPAGFGEVDLSALFLMQGCSTHMRHQIVSLLFPLVTTVMNKKSGGATTGESGKWSGHLFCRLFSLPPEAAARVQLRC